ncbi:MAG: hypothetical protein ACPIOQ_82535, partial [Promethearchaeia archaeon]
AFAACGQIRNQVFSRPGIRKRLVSGPSFSVIRVIYALSLLFASPAGHLRWRHLAVARCHLTASATCRRREGRED